MSVEFKPPMETPIVDVALQCLRRREDGFYFVPETRTILEQGLSQLAGHASLVKAVDDLVKLGMVLRRRRGARIASELLLDVVATADESKYDLIPTDKTLHTWAAPSKQPLEFLLPNRDSVRRKRAADSAI